MPGTDLWPARIFLIGLMGAGKSSIGAELARQLGWPYLDNDVLLAQQTGSATPDLAKRGAAVLHTREVDQMRQLLRVQAPYVAGVAASVGDSVKNLALLAAAGWVVYLRATPQTLARRVEEGHGRPWLADSPLGVLTQMHRSRDGAYRAAAAIVVETDRTTSADVAQLLIVRLRDAVGAGDVTREASNADTVR